MSPVNAERFAALKRSVAESEQGLNTGFRPGYTDGTGAWQASTWTSSGTSAPYPPAPSVHFGFYEQKPQPIEETIEIVKEEKFIVGNGKTTAFTFPTTEDFPAVAVYSRVVEGEGSEETTTVTELGSDKVTISVTQGEQITVEFVEAPARRGAVILVG